MELVYRGANCIEIIVKKVTLVVDGRLSLVGLKDITIKDAVYIATQADFSSATADGLCIDGPGEYEVRDMSIRGVAAQRMIDDSTHQDSTIYKIVADGVSIVVVGHVNAPLTEEQLESIGVIDIAVVPVGGNGYTLDAQQAASVVRQLEPKVVVPTHYADPGVRYEVPQNALDEFFKEMGGERQTVSSYKIKGAVLPATLTVVEITRS